MDIKGISRNDFYVLYNKKNHPGFLFVYFGKNDFMSTKPRPILNVSEKLLGNVRTTLKPVYNCNRRSLTNTCPGYTRYPCTRSPFTLMFWVSVSPFSKLQMSTKNLLELKSPKIVKFWIVAFLTEFTITGCYRFATFTTLPH